MTIGKNLDLVEKILVIVSIVIICTLIAAAMFKQEKISKANVEIETRDYVFYSYKETIEISLDGARAIKCIEFYDVVKEYKIEHCGEYTVRYLK